MSNWKTTADIREEIQEIIADLRAGTITVSEARELQRGIRTGVKSVELDLKHAELTGRLGKGDSELESIAIAQPTSRKKRVRAV